MLNGFPALRKAVYDSEHSSRLEPFTALKANTNERKIQIFMIMSRNGTNELVELVILENLIRSLPFAECFFPRQSQHEAFFG